MRDDCLIPASVQIEDGATIGSRVVFVGGQAVVRSGAEIEPAAVVGRDVTVGQGALVRAGAVVLRSVPPNAVVEGNPAQIVGYRRLSEPLRRGPALAADAAAFGDTKAPSKLELGVGGAALYLMRRVADARGSLTVGEFTDELPFHPRRYFLVFDVPSQELRGEHAHRLCHQFLICAKGSCRVLLDDGEDRCEVTLDRPELAVYMPPMIWGTQYRYSADALLLVFASLPYDAADYIRLYDTFLAEVDMGRVR